MASQPPGPTQTVVVAPPKVTWKDLLPVISLLVVRRFVVRAFARITELSSSQASRLLQRGVNTILDSDVAFDANTLGIFQNLSVTKHCIDFGLCELFGVVAKH